MDNYVSLLFCFISSITVFAMTSSCGAASNEEKEVYIVYMGALPEGGDYSPTSQHATLLQQVTGTSSVADSLVRSYKRSFNGFAAKLTKEEKQKLANMKGVVSVFPNTILKPQTTRSWDFMGFKETAQRELTAESDVIVGVIDTGIWPESDSFKDDGFGPPPKKWKGACKGGQNFTCNNKVIGARFYTSDSARDDEGHGSHTASTAAGNKVKGASFYGIAKGTARGGVPSARIAAYRVCNAEGCSAEAVLGAFDDAIADGVDVITISIGGDFAQSFEFDTIAIGAFHAMAKGIVTSQSAGNSGPDLATISSTSPWVISVGASTFGRVITTDVVLGNGKKFVGNSVNSFSLNSTNIPLVYGSQAEYDNCSDISHGACFEGCLDESLVKGKIVMCDDFDGILEGYRAGALGVITVKRRISPNTSSVVPLPASALTQDDYNSVKAYYKSLKKPTAIIAKSEETNDSGAPQVASFSARGPNYIIPEILKPDVIAPGVGVLAAYSLLASPSIDKNDPRRVQYNFISGTSMSCPHVGGLAAYIKSFHLDWSPSAIKSAIMTTAWPLNVTEQSDAVYDHGSGHINPVKAINPGLVYDAGKEDYIKLLCSAGYSEDVIKQISGENTACKNGSATSPKDFNYPSMTSSVSPDEEFSTRFERTVTNVGLIQSTYKAQVSSNPKLTIKVVPEILSFDALNQKKTFVVSISGKGISKSEVITASLTWSDGTHIVRSPIVAASNNKPEFI